MQTEITQVRSAPVPGRENVRADEHGRIWRWDGTKWQKLPRKYRYFFRGTAGEEIWVTARRLVCAAWHGERTSDWYAKVKDGYPKDSTEPDYLEWCLGKPGRSGKLTDEMEDLIRHRAARGETLSALAREYKVSVATTCKVCKSRVAGGVSVARTRWLTRDERSEIIRQRKAGAKVVTLAARFKRSQKRITEIMREEKARSAREDPGV